MRAGGLAAGAVVAALAVTTLAGAALAGAAAGSGIVSAIEVRSDGVIQIDELRHLVSITPGQPLADEDVRRTLRALQASDVASDVEILARPAGDGTLVVVVVVRSDVIVSGLAFDGDLGVSRTALADALPPILGRALIEDRLVRGVFRLQQLLLDRGYLDAQVRIDVRPDPLRPRATVVYHVAAGAPYRVGAVDMEGADPVPRAELDKAMRSRAGENFRVGAAREDEDRLRHVAIDKGYRTATLERLPDRVDHEKKTVGLGYRFHLGPEVDFVLVGAERKALQKRDLLPFLGDAGYDEALVLQSVDRLKRDFQERGYSRVEIDKSETVAENRMTLRLEVRPGARFTLEELRFTGNDSFPSDRLARLLATSPNKLLVPGSGRLVDEDLASDLANLRSFYALQGFDRARIGPAAIETRGSRLSLTIPIVEGARRRVADVKLAGVDHLDPASLLAAIPLQAGGPYHRLLADRSVDRLRELYERQGYGEAIVSPAVVWDSSETIAAVTFRVLEGPRAVVHTIVVRGNQKTKSAVVRRFVGLRPGDPVHFEGLLSTQRRLYQLGIFSRVAVTAPPSPEGAPADEIVVDLSEGKTRSLAYGLGYDSVDRGRVSLRISQGNLFGRAASIEAELLVSRQDERYRLLYRQPYLGPLPVELRTAAYRERENRPSFDVRRRGAQVAATRLFGDLKATLVFDYRLIDLLSSDPELGDIPRENLNARVASVTPSVVYDRRNDLLNPTTGWSAGLDVESAFPVLSATADFTKLFSQATGYVSLGAAGTVAASLRLGSILPHIGSSSDPIQNRVPIPELFFAGGRTSHRAYGRDELGVLGETLAFDPTRKKYVPLGGGGLALGNFDYRFPIAGDLGGTLFVDAGNVWPTLEKVELHQFKVGAGLGLRYQSPIGPLRLEVGWKLNRLPGEDPYVWFISLGNPF